MASSTLFISSLHPEHTQDQLTSFFQQRMPAEFASAKVCYDHEFPTQSLKYGYLNFKTADGAQKAFDSLNYHILPPATKPYILHKYIRDPQQRKNPDTNVFINNIPVNYEAAKLHKLFEDSGNITSVHVSEYHGEKSTHGFVSFETTEQAKKAIESHNKQEVDGFTLLVEHAKDFSTFIHDEIYMANFPSTFTEETIKELTSPYGTVTKIILKVPEDQTKTAHAFVVFSSESEANEAISQLNGKQISELAVKLDEKKETKPEANEEEQKNDTLHVNVYYTRKERNIHKKKLRRESRLKNLYIRNFPHYFDTEDLRELFKPFGGIVSCVVMKSSEGISRGFGFCSFENIQQAQSAYIQLNGKQLPVKKDSDSNEPGSTVELYVNYAIPREDFMRQSGKAGVVGTHSMFPRQRGHAATQARQPYPNAGAQYQYAGYPQGFPHPFMYANSPNAMGGTPRQGFDANVASPPVQMAQGMPYQLRPGYGPRRMTQQPPFFFPMGNRMWNPALMYPPNMMYAQLNRGMYSPNFTQSPPSAMTQPSAGSPYTGIMASNGSPSSAGPATGSPGSTGAIHSPVGVHQSSPASGGQPGTPTSASAPSSPASSGTGSLNGSPSSGPSNVFVDRNQLQKMSLEDQKNYLGEALFAKISQIDPARAGKITGMLLELEVSELIHFAEDNAELQAKVQEAQRVLKEAESQPHA